MAAIIVISDIHASNRWREMLGRRKEDDEVIFLGDYFDRRGHGPFAASQVENFLDICAYARKHAQTTLLLGNHDYNYTPWAKADVSWEPDARTISAALMANLNMIQIVAIRNNLPKQTIFSHGGLTMTFMADNGLREPEEVNKLWQREPEAFEWIPADPYTGKRSNIYGDDPWQSPIWARTRALYEDGLQGYDQVVGHTPVPEPEEFQTRYGDTILLTCTLDDQPVRIEKRPASLKLPA